MPFGLRSMNEVRRREPIARRFARSRPGARAQAEHRQLLCDDVGDQIYPDHGAAYDPLLTLGGSGFRDRYAPNQVSLEQ